jgi:phage terminase large subunit GpA-like protein
VLPDHHPTDFAAAGRALARAALLAGLRPDPVMSVSEWADRHRRLAVEASPRPGQWSTATTPYLREVMDCLAPSHPAWKVTAKKGAQLGFTDVGINWMGMVADVAPGPMGVFQPTIEACFNFVKTKVDPALAVSPRLRRRVAEQKSRDGAGSTTRHKRFAGGFWVFSGANSSAALQMFSFRYLFKDELSEWPEDAGGRGDPSQQADARTDAYEAIRKIYQASTPGLKGMCRISAEFEASDQRRYYLPCPLCGHFQVLLWGGVEETDGGQAGYRCGACLELIPHHLKSEMLKDEAAGGRALWLPCYPTEDGEVPKDVLSPEELELWRSRGSHDRLPGESGTGRQPGFWISQLYSPFKTWSAILEQWRKAEGDVQAEKVFHQQVLGLEWEETGEAPDYELLMLRREDYPLQRVPAGALVLTCGVDVQARYLQYEVVGWGEGLSSWSIDYGVLEGDTTDEPVWQALDVLLRRTYPDGRGEPRSIEMTTIDAGYNTPWVYHFVRRRPLAMAAKGQPGHLTPLLGLPKPQEVNWKGKRIGRGVMLWPIGDWQLKAELYANLRKEGPKDGAEAFPPGYCHFSTGHDQQFFEQLTAEHLVTRVRGGREDKAWVLSPGRRNEALDCRKMARVAAEHLGLTRMTADDWRQLAAQRGAQLELSDLWTRPAGLPSGPQRPPENVQGSGPSIDDAWRPPTEW